MISLWSVAGPAPVQAQDDPDPARFDSEIEAFEQWDRKNAVPERPLLFVGSSSIRMWPTAERFPGLPVVNRGFGGSHISDVNHFAERIVFKYKPRAIVFYAGDNDIADAKTPERVMEDFEAFVGRVRKAGPGTPIVWLPIKPSLSRWNLWPEMQRANAMVEEYARSHDDVVYADLATPMMGEDRQPRPSLFLDDGLHLNETGYDVWTQALRPVLDEVLRGVQK
jgi:lysophospholipase L1-like esterase